MCTACKALSTLFTRMWLFTSMASMVTFQVWTGRKLFSTPDTSKWLLTRVNSHVSLEICEFSESSLTFSALEQFALLWCAALHNTASHVRRCSHVSPLQAGKTTSVLTGCSPNLYMNVAFRSCANETAQTPELVNTLCFQSSDTGLVSLQQSQCCWDWSYLIAIH
jgi:hypothetical protein